MSIEIPSIADFAAARRSAEAMSAIANIGNAIGARAQASGNAVQGLREIIGSDDNQSVAVAELAKVGVSIAELLEHDDGKPGMDDRKAVALCRRAVNKLSEAARSPSLDANGRKRIMQAIDWCAAHIAVAEHQNAADAEATEAWDNVLRKPSPSADALRDHEGRRIGVMLTAKDLRDESKIATKIGVRGQDTESGFVTGESRPASLGAFFRAVAGGPVPEGAIKASLSEGVDTSGGYAVPSILMPGILQALSAASATLSAGAGIAVLTEPGAKYRIAAINTLPTAGWRTELGAVATSDAGFRSVEIVPKSLAVMVKISRELLQDGAGVESAIRIALAQSMAAAIDSAALNGSGTDPEPLGILNSAGISAIDLGTNGAPLTNYASFIKARRVLADAAAPEPTAAIVANRDMETLDGLVDTLGQPLRRPDALSNLRFVSTPRLPINQTHGTATAASSMIVADFSTVMIAMREQLSIQLLRETFAATGELAFLAHARVDVALTYPTAVAVINGVVPA